MRTSLFLALLLLPLPLWATPWHVYEGQSIQAAINGAVAGDDVIVHPGTYYESITLKAGVDVYSFEGSSSVTIDGGANNHTVYFSGNGGGLHFGSQSGGQDGGFTIDGSAHYGMYFNGCWNMHLGDIHVVSDPPIWDPWQPDGAVYFYNSGYQQFGVANLRIHGQTACKGLYLEHCDIAFNDLHVYDVTGTGAHLFWDSSYFTDPVISGCGKGFELWHSDVFVDGGSIEDCTFGIWASEDPYYYYDHYTFMGVDFQYCTTGVCFTPQAPFTMEAYLISCTFEYCTNGVSLTRVNGHVKGCDFLHIDDVALACSGNGGALILGGPTVGEWNDFYDVTGVGVHVTGGASPTVEGSFHSVFGTGILCEGGSTPTIRDCILDGSNGCFEGIATSGENTMATIRYCSLRDYASPVSPGPRAAIAYRATANLGTLASHGENNFEDNTCDLWYSNKAAVPDYLYAQMNWWGDSPPDAGSFGGRVD
ncbi:right-handed parallel beta-helix repeat-containing protein, partial [Candidatus Fermentibacteria bacterium]|nr:right-handed parallel beta-helix repeat-containing protein [Candidatus Fermentibacteria bacterium]